MTEEDNVSAIPEFGSDEWLGAYAERVIDGDPTADLFDLDDDFVDIVIGKAYQFYRRNDLERAEILARGARALDETRPYPNLLLGDILMRRGETEDAVEPLEAACELEPDNLEAKAKLGEALCRSSDGSRGVELLEQVLEADDVSDEVRRRVEAIRASNETAR